MSDQDVFNTPVDPQETQEQVAPSQTVDVFVDKLMSITREDGSPKYESLEKALDALAESQSFIPQLQQENAAYKQAIEELSKKLTEAESLQEIVNRMNAVNKEEEQVVTPTNVVSNQDDATVEQKIEALLQRKEQEKQAMTNLKKVNDTIISKFGDKAPEVVAAKAAELGITTEELKQLAARSPNLILGHFGAAAPSPSPSSSSVNSHGFKVQHEPMKAPEKSLISGSGANDANRREFMAKLKANIMREHGITE